MIDVSVLYCGMQTPSQPHRYGKQVTLKDSHKVASSAYERRPIVVWNVTRTCNLKCVHCYSDSDGCRYDGELTTQDGKTLIDDLAQFSIPALLFSGGEPLVRSDIFELMDYATKKGVRIVLSTNGTLLDNKVVARLRELNVSYVGISLDGMGQTNDFFRGVKGAFERALNGFRACTAAGQKVGLRLTLTKHTASDLDSISDLIEQEGIQRACFYHLVPSGRGKNTVALTPQESRNAIDKILKRTKDLHQRSKNIEILTVDNHCDGPYLYLTMLKENNPRSQEVFDLLKWNGGGLYSSGVGIGCVDNIGNVHPDQFWWHYRLGNVRERPFSEIWQDTSDPLMAGLKDKKSRLKGRCASCKFVDLCGGSLRVRADIALGDPWAPDPLCYLTDEEIGCKELTASQAT